MNSAPVDNTPVDDLAAQEEAMLKAMEQMMIQKMNKKQPIKKQPFSSYDSYNSISNDLGSYNDDEETVPYTTVASEAVKETNLEDTIQLSMRLKKKVVQASSFGEQTFPMLVSLLADDGTTASKAPIDLVCVLDVSGSMQGEKIELVKRTLGFLLKYLGDADRLSIVTFSSSATRLVPLFRTNENNKDKIQSAIQRIYASGGTNINEGMTKAFEILKQRKHMNPVSSIFLLSDGLDNGAQGKVKASLSKYTTLNDVTIHTFGFGHDHDSQLMTDIADLRDGNFYNIKELEAVDKAFIDCLGALLSSVAQSVELKIQSEQSEALQGVEIPKAYGDPAMWKQENQTYTTKMLSLISGRQKDFVLELKIPTTTKELQDNEKNVKVASAEIIVADLNNKVMTKKADLYITLLNEAEETKEEEEEEDVDKEVMTNFYRLKGASLMADAHKLSEQRKYDDAKKILQNFKEELENCPLREIQFIKNLVKDMEGAMVYVEPQVYQKMGKHGLHNNARAHAKQKTTFDSANYYQNKQQTDMLDQLEAMKNA